MDLARFTGTDVPEDRIELVLARWTEAPDADLRGLDRRLLDPWRRFCRTPAGEPRGEHAIEADVLRANARAPRAFGYTMIDGVNALPLTRDRLGGRKDNVEADMLLLGRSGDDYVLFLVEVKDASDNAWFAVIENLRQLKLLHENPEQRRLFHARLPDLDLRDPLPVQGVVLAPASFYEARGKKKESVQQARELLRRMATQHGVTVRLAEWEPLAREMRPVGAPAPRRVLHIDDEAPLRLLCRMFLEERGIEYLEAVDGIEGLELAEREAPDLILLDIMMPALDGWRVAEELAATPATAHISVVFLTPRAEYRDRLRGLEFGALDYVTVPFNPIELAERVDQMLELDERGRVEWRRRQLQRLADLQDQAEGDH